MVVPMLATVACARLEISMLPAPASRSLDVDPQMSRVLYGTMGRVSRASKRRSHRASTMGGSNLSVQTATSNSSPNALAVNVAGGGSCYAEKDYLAHYLQHELT